MDYKEILNLMKEMNHTDLTKLEIEEEGFKICIEKTAPAVNVAQTALSHPAYAMNYAPGHMPATSFQPQTYHQQSAEAVNIGVASNESREKQPEEECGKKLVSPMVGTFYSASSPDKSPFVKVGDKVKKGQTICIIEAMKLMNEIESEHDGEIVKILLNNEDMVEYGQPLFLIR